MPIASCTVGSPKPRAGGQPPKPAALRLYLGYQRRLLLRGPLPTALNDNLATHSKDSFWSPQKDQASLSARPDYTPQAGSDRTLTFR